MGVAFLFLVFLLSLSLESLSLLDDVLQLLSPADPSPLFAPSLASSPPKFNEPPDAYMRQKSTCEFGHLVKLHLTNE